MDISFQLYSSREVPSQINFLQTLSSLGYTQVEGYGGVYQEPQAFKTAMDAVGIAMVSGHFSIDSLESSLDEQLTLASTLGMQHIFVPFLAPDARPTDSAGYIGFAKRLNELHTKVSAAGFGFGWHNHDFELTLLKDGGVPMEIILNECPDIAWEADLAWVAFAQADPFEWVERFGSRISSVHVKDIAPQGENLQEDGWADVGMGVIDWQKLTAAVRTAAPDALMVMEHDKPADAERFARTSITNFKSF